MMNHQKVGVKFVTKDLDCAVSHPHNENIIK